MRAELDTSALEVGGLREPPGHEVAETGCRQIRSLLRVARTESKGQRHVAESVFELADISVRHAQHCVCESKTGIEHDGRAQFFDCGPGPPRHRMDVS